MLKCQTEITDNNNNNNLFTYRLHVSSFHYLQ